MVLILFIYFIFPGKPTYSGFSLGTARQCDGPVEERARHPGCRHNREMWCYRCVSPYMYVDTHTHIHCLCVDIALCVNVLVWVSKWKWQTHTHSSCMHGPWPLAQTSAAPSPHPHGSYLGEVRGHGIVPAPLSVIVLVLCRRVCLHENLSTLHYQIKKKRKWKETQAEWYLFFRLFVE